MAESRCASPLLALESLPTRSKDCIGTYRERRVRFHIRFSWGALCTSLLLSARGAAKVGVRGRNCGTTRGGNHSMLRKLTVALISSYPNT